MKANQRKRTGKTESTKGKATTSSVVVRKVALPPVERPDWLADVGPEYAALVLLPQQAVATCYFALTEHLSPSEQQSLLVAFEDHCRDVLSFVERTIVKDLASQPQEERLAVYNGCDRICMELPRIVRRAVFEDRIAIANIVPLVDDHCRLLRKLDILNAFQIEETMRGFDEWLAQNTEPLADGTGDGAKEDPQWPTLTDWQQTMFEEIVASTTTLTAYDLQARLPATRKGADNPDIKTVRKHLGILLGHGLAEYPGQQRDGVSISAKGREFAAWQADDHSNA